MSICSRHHIAEILLKLVLSTNQSINQSINVLFYRFEILGCRMVWFTEDQAEHYLHVIDAGSFKQVTNYNLSFREWYCMLMSTNRLWFKFRYFLCHIWCPFMLLHMMFDREINRLFSTLIVHLCWMFEFSNNL